MQYKLWAMLTSALILGSATALLAQTAPAKPVNVQPPPVRGIVYTAEATATVESADPQAHQILLRLPDNSLVTLSVGPEVKNLDQLRPGDHVMARYIEAEAVHLANPDGGQQAQAPGNAGAPGASGNQVHDVSKVQAVDPSRNTVSFADQKNKVQTIVIHDPSEVAVLKTLHTGGPIDITYTQGFAVSLTPVPG